MPHQISEERTRKEMIDPQLERAGWYLRDHARVKIEIPVDGAFFACEPPLDMFRADAVERRFTEKEVEEVVEFANRLAVS
ncbi:MAG: hypothetical protein QMD04_11530 [Anaerolineales bacterium]|nr:hypothetical protein [Anaerolineales bacterium]